MTMNLGVVTRSLEHYGGAEIFLMECVRRWQEKARVTLYATRIDTTLLEEFGVDPSRIKTVLLADFDQDERRFDLVEDMLILPRLWEHDLGAHDVYFLNGFPLHLTRCFPGVYMCHEPLRMLYDLRYQYAANEGMAAVHIYPEQKYRHPSIRRLEVQLELIESVDRRARFDYLVVNSRAMSAYARNVYQRTPDLVAYPGINPRQSKSPPSRGKRAVFVGRLWKHKRIHLLIQAIALTGDGFLDIVGQGPERGALEDLAASLNVSDRVVFHGELSREEVTALYEDATCGAYVPVREPFGMMPLEAAAAGRPVIVTPEGGYSELLNSDAAIFVPPSPRPIARAMTRLFEDPALAAHKGDAARSQVSRVTWDKTANDLYRLFGEVKTCSRRTAGPGKRPLVGAYYYPWYDAGRPMRHWNENMTTAAVVDLPLRGAYTSYRPATVERHLELADRAGLDFFTVNWEVGHSGVNPRDLKATECLFSAVEQAGATLKLSILLSIQTSMLEPIRQAFALIGEYSSRSAWLELRNRPALWFLISTDFFGAYYAHKDELETLHDRFAILSTGAITAPHYFPLDIREFIDGWSLLSPFRVGKPDNWEERWLSTYRYHTTDISDPVRMFTISPGYDDRHLTSEERLRTEPRQVDREGGNVYRRMIDCAKQLLPAPEVIMISSFNEFHETTQIEPSYLFGDFYLEATRDFTRGLRLKN